jgi:uncharacterized protein YcbX
MARLARISTTPVKGTALEHPDRAMLVDGGIEGNRRFHLADRAGAHVGVFEFGPLVQVRSALDTATGVLRCAFPDGTVVEGHEDDLGPATVTTMDGHDTPAREVRGGFAEVFSAFVGQPVRLLRADRDVDGNDVEPITLVSDASVRDLAARAGTTELDPRRFRMTLDLDETEPYEEDAWSGREVEVGAAVLRIGGQVPRCRVTTQDPSTGVRDVNTLKLIAAYRPLMPDGKGIPFGMYAQVVVPGVVRVGDAVLPRSPH